MIYKFNTRGTNDKDNTYLEFSTDNDSMMVVSGNYEEEIKGNIHYLHVTEIDDMIVALTSLKNEISEWKRSQLKK
jgi:hypothetical protein